MRVLSTPSPCAGPTRWGKTVAATTQVRRSRVASVTSSPTPWALLVVTVTAASVQDRDGGQRALELAHGWYRRLVHVFADGAYAGRLVEWARTKCKITIEVVSRPRISTAFRSCPALGGRADIGLADALAPLGPRLRAAARDPRSVRQVGDGGDHAQSTRTPTGTKGVGTAVTLVIKHVLRESRSFASLPHERFALFEGFAYNGGSIELFMDTPSSSLRLLVACSV